jgi:hypothetical protein
MKPTKLNPIRMTIPLLGANLTDALSLGIAFKIRAIKAGGNGRVYRAPDAVYIDLQGLPADEIQALITPFIDAVIRKNGEFQIVITARTADLPKNIVHGEYLSEKLTKRLLTNLPVGARLIVWNVCAWRAHLAEHTDRQRLWEQAVAEGVAGRNVSVVWTESDLGVILVQGR